MASGAAGAASLELLKDIGDNDVLASSSPLFLGAAGNRAYFAATPYGGTPQLYRTDGTSANTVPVVTATTIRRPQEGREIAGRVVFLADGNSDRPKEIWTTDGTDAGTVRLAETGDFGSHYVWLGVRRESHGFFYRTGDITSPLLVTDGTPAGTRNLTPGRNVAGTIAQPFDNAGNLYFYSVPSGSLDGEIWVSDGTVAGTRAVFDPADTSLTIFSRLMYVSGGSALVAGEDGLGRGVFSVNTATGVATRLSNLTHLVRTDGIHVGSLHYFIMGSDLWRTDGTAAGTFALTTGGLDGDLNLTLMAVGDRVLFGHFDGTTGQELWSTDGTLAGTVMLPESRDRVAMDDGRHQLRHAVGVLGQHRE
jgi:ELWxxDGT repeat protein